MARTTCFSLLLMAFIGGMGREGLAQATREKPVFVAINEVLASNGSIIRNPQGRYEDWIELYNPGPSAVDLGGCYLTDDLARPTKWQIPTGNPAATTIPAKGFLLIWADGGVAGAGLHAGFRLSDEGEEIGLFASDGARQIDSLSFGKQQMDVSWGRFPDGGADLLLLTHPTPGAANVVIHEGIVEPPQFDVKSRICTSPITVTLTTATEGAQIFYTIDGSDPFAAARERPIGSTYWRPLVINTTLTLKAVAWRSGWRQSEVVAERYVFIDRSLQSFTSPLAIAVVDTFGRGISREAVPAYGCFIDVGEGARASVNGPVSFAGAAAINIRGQSSSGFPKRQYHFETQDGYGDDLDVSILGLPPESDWVLQGPYSDKSLMRNVLSYQWANEMGRYAPRTRFMEMFLNSDDSTISMADYVGVYVLMEKIKIGPSRVDIAKLEPSDNAEPEITGGYIIKKDKSHEQAGADAEDQAFTTSRGQRLIYDDPTGAELTPAQEAWIVNFMNSFEAALYGPSFKDPINGYAKFIDVGSFIDLHILVELTKNIDGFRLSTYMHKDREGKLNMGPAWDYNLSLGNADYADGWNATGWYFSQLGNDAYPYWRRLFEDPEFRLAYADRWFALRQDVLATNRLIGMIEGYATLLDEPAARNFDRWRILGQYVWPNWYIARTFREEIVWMQKWVSDRLAWMDGQIAAEYAPVPPAFNRQGGHVESGFALAMSGPGTIYYTTDGSDPKLFAGAALPTPGTVLVPENAPKRVLVPAGPVDDAWRGGRAFNDSAWTPGTGGVGFERSTGYENLIGLDVGPQMYGKNATCYIRIPFSFLGDLRKLGSLTLKVRYDDGFVAYLNGTEIARRNCAGVPAWDSAASTQHDDFDAVNLESVEITDFRGILQRADNLLAIQAMNAPATSSDFLLGVELTASEAADPQAAGQVLKYAGPIPLAASTRIKARSLNAGRWSALNEAVFAVGPVAESVRISEIMYHPSEISDLKSEISETEYIELTNIGSAAVNLNQVRFTDGIEFTFPSFSLLPAAYCLVVKDLAAFEATYGPGLPVAGQYTGSLDNAGEDLELRDAAGRTIHRFHYNDGWYDQTDGPGFSLTLKNPHGVDPNSLGEKDFWRPSTYPGGSPGSGD